MIFDLLNPASSPEAYSRMSRFRQMCPVAQITSWLVFVSRDADVRTCLHNHEILSNRGDLIYIDEENDPPTLLQLDPPEHTYKRKMQTHLLPRRVAPAYNFIHALAHRLVDQMIADNSVDLMQALAFPLPILVLMDLVHIPEDQQAKFARWVEEIKDNVPLTYKGLKSWSEFSCYMQDMIRQRRTTDGPPDDMLTHLIQAQYEGACLSDDDIRMAITQLIIGGTNAVSFLIGNSVYELLKKRYLWEEVKANRSLVPIAIEESLRHDPPVLWVMRRCKKMATIANSQVTEGMQIMLSLASANHDEAVWADAEIFSLHRSAQSHVSFGYGPHFCLGASLARLEVTTILEVLLDRLPNLHLIPDFRYEGVKGTMWYGPRRLPVCW